MTLKCSYSTEFYELAWLAGDKRIYPATRETSEKLTDDVSERIQSNVFEGNSHRITIMINKTEDENKPFTCKVATFTGRSDDSELIPSVLSKLGNSRLAKLES